MPTQFLPVAESSIQLATLNSALSDTEKAWHLLSLLLSIGHPVPPLELSSLCTLFPSPPPLIHSLASIPNSPIALTNTCETPLVTVSLLGRLAVKFLFPNSNFRCLMDGPGVVLVRMYSRKRKRKQIGWFDSSEKEEETVSVSSKRIRNGFCSREVQFHKAEDIRRSLIGGMRHFPIKLNSVIMTPDFLVRAFPRGQGYITNHIQQIEDRENLIVVEESKEEKRIVVHELDEESALPSQTVDEQVVHLEGNVAEIDVKISGVTLGESAGVNDAFGAAYDCCAEATGVVGREQELLVDCRKMKGKPEQFSQLISSALRVMEPESYGKRKNIAELELLAEEPIALQEKNRPKSVTTAAKKQLSMKVISVEQKAPRRRALFQPSEQSKPVNTPKGKKNFERDGPTIGMVEKPMHRNAKEGKREAAAVSSKDQMEPKEFPVFESFIVEDEEGSGGYGTVYRARRKQDGTVVAIKCPHANAHRNNVSNELRMLERFGGRNFVIKYEGHLKSENSDCFVLEHVQHDRPEILKKEIDVFQLRWYGYCLFRALASLHKQVVVHRDVKPGNFLFCRKASKGYLIDFNLAMDLHHKYGTPNKLKAKNDVNLNHTTLANAKPLPPIKSRRFPGATSLDVLSQEAVKSKNLKRKNVDQAKASNYGNCWNVAKSQGADGSGITSVKDMTSGRTPSAERLREPLPCQGRKELISLLQEAMHSPNHEASSAPISVRKRVAAPPGKVDGRMIYPTPMPLNFHGSAFIGDGKLKREGPCAGTKGFRAPEVLFRSLHQGTKVDIWSAGVTLLYLITGRTPFYGDPEQNIKDIGKLRGSEDLWEVAKLHDRESAFPLELCSTQYLPSISLLEWCKINTKRRDFMDAIPSSLLDLVDKCLTVNPRLRISAEDALKHEFFAPCHESLRKHRLLRQELSLDSAMGLPLQGQSTANPSPVSRQQDS